MNLAPTPQPAAPIRPPALPGVETVLVYGFGLSGRAAAGLLLRQGLRVVAVDARVVEAGVLESEGRLRLERESELGELPPEVGAVVLSPGVPQDRPLLLAARAAGLPILGEVELAYRFLQGELVGITGTNGKSTTTALCGAMLEAGGLKAEVCGNIGQPMTSSVAEVSASGGERVFVAELSSFQLESLSTLRCRAAALLNVAADHLDRYDSFEDYAAAKGHLFDRQTAEDVAVVNAEDPLTLRLATASKARCRQFSSTGPVEDGCGVEAGTVVERAPGQEPIPLFAVEDLPLAGVHNLENAMAAALLARCWGVEPSALRTALKSFEALPHRMQRVAVQAGVTYWDDSKATNVAAALRSLEGIEDGRGHLIFGGVSKGDDLAPLVELARRKARSVWLIGEAAEEFAAAFAGVPGVESVGDLESAVPAAAALAQPGDAVLLAPACASYDQFPSFAARGDRFAELVQQLSREGEVDG